MWFSAVPKIFTKKLGKIFPGLDLSFYISHSVKKNEEPNYLANPLLFLFLFQE